MPRKQDSAHAVISARDLSIHYDSRDAKSRHLALAGVSFELAPGEILGILGQSGSGKSTLAAALAGRLESRNDHLGSACISGGDAAVLGTSLRHMGARQRDRLHLRVGFLEQDGAERLDSRLTVSENVAEPIYSRDRKFSSREAGIAVATLVDSVRLPLGLMSRYPHELSSGQRQRVALARALVLEPQLLIADEPTRGVDVTVRRGVLDVLSELKRERGFSAVVVSSDLAVVSEITDRTMILCDGTMVGLGPIDQVLKNPVDPYLKALAASRFDKVPT